MNKLTKRMEKRAWKQEKAYVGLWYVTLEAGRPGKGSDRVEQVTRVRSPLNLCLTVDSRISTRDFPGGPVVKTRDSTAGGAGSISNWGTKIPHALRSGQKSKKQTNKQKPKTPPQNENQL